MSGGPLGLEKMWGAHESQGSAAPPWAFGLRRVAALERDLEVAAQKTGLAMPQDPAPGFLP